MAETAPTNKKRRLRAPSQTVREQAQKAQAEAEKPKRRSPLRSAGKSARKPFARLSPAFQKQPLKTIVWPLRMLGRIIWPRYLRNAFSELRVVTWPNFKQTQQLTFAVLLFAAIFGASVAVVDYGLDKLFKAVLLK